MDLSFIISQFIVDFYSSVAKLFYAFTLKSLNDRIIHLLTQGKTSYEIANILFISKKTVDTHRKNMLKNKMQIDDGTHYDVHER